MATLPAHPPAGPWYAGVAARHLAGNMVAHALHSCSDQCVSCRKATRPAAVACVMAANLASLLWASVLR
eukprot:9471447-Pyramimonas_sp.AAC.1